MHTTMEAYKDTSAILIDILFCSSVIVVWLRFSKWESLSITAIGYWELVNDGGRQITSSIQQWLVSI